MAIFAIERRRFMKVALHFYLLNENFSPEYAEANHGGQESENNPLYEWEDELEVKNLKQVELLRDSGFTIEGYLPDESPFAAQFKNMFTIRMTTDEGQLAHLGVSESILEKYELHETEDQTTIKAYIKDYEPHGNPMPGLYVASKEFPKELVF